MKVVILCGGLGTRLREETEFRPKPMVEVGGRPILWHIMKMLRPLRLPRVRPLPGLPRQHDQGILPQLRGDEQRLHHLPRAEIADSLPRRSRRAGLRRHPGRHRASTRMTGGRVKRIEQYVDGDTFLVTYGDGVSDVEHPRAGRVPPEPRQARHGDRGAARSRASACSTWRTNDRVGSVHREAADPTAGSAPASSSSNREVFDYLGGDDCILEREPLERLAPDGAADGLSPRRLLLRDGHLPRVPAPQRALGQRRGAVEGLGVSRVSGRIGRCWSPAPPAWSAAGWRGAWSKPAPTSSAWSATGCRRANWSAAGMLDRVKVVRGDVRDRDVLERALGEYEVDTVFHLAAQTIVGIANRNPDLDLREQHPGHLERARSLPPVARREADRGRVVRQGVRRSGGAAVRRRHAAAKGGIPTTSASRAPT